MSDLAIAGIARRAVSVGNLEEPVLLSRAVSLIESARILALTNHPLGSPVNSKDGDDDLFDRIGSSRSLLARITGCQTSLIAQPEVVYFIQVLMLISQPLLYL